MVKLDHTYFLLRAIALSIFISFSAKAQLTVSNSLTPAQLVQTVLLGSGVTASNITYNGAPLAIGKFTGSASNLGLASGVIMSSGKIANAVGPNNTSGKSTSNNRPGDPDLDQIFAYTYSYDAAILEFDFIPTSDTVKFRYIFGSEEYMEFVSTTPSGINDGFGFFISGPGITGTFTNNAKNIALIPGTLLPVTMFNLNLNNNGAYYFDNGSGTSGGTAPNGTSVQYDGFTKPMTAISKVQCGQVYHIKLAVADGGDNIYDSGVFLEAESFTSVGPPTAGADISINVGMGCVRQLTSINFNVPSVSWNSIYPGTSGAYNNYLSCTNGCLNPSVTYLTGQPSYVDFQVCGLSLSCIPTTVCDTVRVYFNPPLIISVTPQNPVLCAGQNSTPITVSGSGGTPPYTYLWNNINPSQTINVGNGTYTAKLSDASGCPPVYTTVTVTSYSVPVSANAGPDQTVCNQNPITTLNGSVSGASGGNWSGGTGTFTPTSSTLSGVSYSPSAAELAAGFVNLTLTTTGSGSCAAGTDVVRINYTGFTETISILTTPVRCFGLSDGAATVTLPGTTPPYTYSWFTAPSQTTATASNLAVGTYSVKITNGIGCSATATATITQPAPVTLASTLTQISCPGAGNGSISLSPTGGTGPYTYSWNNGAVTSLISNLTAQIYTVNVTDASACTITSSFTISEPLAIGVALSPTDVNCFGGNSGSVISTVTGGTSPFIYNWSSGTSAPDASGLQAGTYTLTVTDAHQCTATNAVTINQPATQLLVSTTSTNENCNLSNDGTAAAFASGGAGGYSYLWMPGSLTSATISGLSSGTYTLTVTDLKGCQATSFITITEPPALTINLISQVNVSCFGGNNGSVEANASGGLSPYTYSWSNGAMSSLLSNLTSQTYSVTVTDNSGCIVTNSVTITQPLAALSVSLLSTNASCYGLANGAISSSPSGGTVPYTYHWMPGNLATQNVSNLAAGTYTVTVNDMLGCIAANSATISQPTEIVLVTSSINADCGFSNGQTSVSVTGGNSPYTYQWSPAGGTDAIAGGLFSGAYTVVVTDATGCTASQGGNINENSAAVASISSVTNVNCFGETSGSATASASGGTGSFLYSWMPSGGTDATATGLTAGSYTVTIQDNVGCKSLATIDITEPTEITADITTSNVSCFGAADGTASAIASGGNPGYTYQWLPVGSTGPGILNLVANTYSLETTDNSGCVQITPVIITEPQQMSSSITLVQNVNCKEGKDGSATVTAAGGTPVYYYNWLPSGGNGPTESGLAAGSYTVTTTDSKGCSTTASTIITEPLQTLSATNTLSTSSCFGGSTATVGIHPAGGTPSYSYQWNPAVSVNDTAFGLPVGVYSVLISDNNFCQTNLSVTITQPTAITGSLVAINPSCGLSNGSITLQASGGTLPYTYLWSPGGITTQNITNAGPGSYTLLITDALNCSLTLTADLTDTPPPLVNEASLSSVSCNSGNDGSAAINITLGTAPYTITWTPSGGNNLNLTSLTAGTYTVNVSDAAGCQTIDSVIITEPAPLNVSIASITDVLCNGESSGTISLATSGGTPLYSYAWTPSGSTASTAPNLAIGTHTVIVTDQKNCTTSISAVINEPTPLSSSVNNITMPVCFNGSGSATVNAMGGVLPYTYLWSPSNETTNIAVNLIAGTHTVTCTDANGCVSSNTLVITEPSQIITTGGPNDTLCAGEAGSLSATAIGGAGNYYYAWQPSGAITAGTLPITPAGDVTYTVVAYDQIGCPGTPATIGVYIYTLNSSNVMAYATTPICPGQSSSVYVETYGQTGPLTYQWNNNLGTGTGIFTVTPSQAVTYIVTVSNSCGLSVTDSVTVSLNPQPTMNVLSDSSIVCVPGIMMFTDSSLAGNPNDSISSWTWNFGDGTTSNIQNPVHTYNLPGNYAVTLTVTTDGGCTNNSSLTPLTITAYPYPAAVFSANANQLELPNDILILNNQSSGGISYNWSFGDGGSSTLMNPSYLYSTVGVFQVQLIVTSQEGCIDTANAEITTDTDIIFPNVFTPDPDGPSGGIYNINDLHNDIFFAYASGVTDYRLEIFNRWGEKIFETFDFKQGWDGYYKGAICQQDAYVWKAFVKLNDGREINKNGNIIILQ
ncbi:MAG: choice-of-anchor L domain-containing protein [Bacteroidota bacterium]